MSMMKKAIGGSIHRIREFQLEKVNLGDEFDILQIVGEGWFGKILLTEHRSTQTEMVLKALPKPYTSVSDFYREFHYGLHLSAHRNIITTYDVAFETAGFYVFSQEYAPLGDLTSNVTETGLGELHAKRVARQLAAAVHHIHSRELVHRDIKLDNILVFKSDFSRIKLCDFGETRRVNTVVRRHNEWLPYSPPEVLQIDTDDAYKALPAHDVWQFGIVIFVCLTGCLPWQKAANDDPRYARYQNWHSATLNIAKKPKLFQLISSRAQRMFKRLLDPKAEKRPVSVFEVNKFLEDRWLAKLGVEKALNGGADERDELCPSMYSFHSSLEEKNQLLFTLTQYGIETTVDRSKKKDRIREWIQSSAIMEENEDESEEEFFEEEDLNMKGKHFPERRESKKINEVEKQSGDHIESSKKKSEVKQTFAPPKPIGRKNPFAPQVAKERQTIAQSANFPNGDPNLATKLNGVPISNDQRANANGDYLIRDAYDKYQTRHSYQNEAQNYQRFSDGSRQSPSKVSGTNKATNQTYNNVTSTVVSGSNGATKNHNTVSYDSHNERVSNGSSNGPRSSSLNNATSLNSSGNSINASNSPNNSLNNSITSPSSSLSTFSPNSSLNNNFSMNGSFNNTVGLNNPLNNFLNNTLDENSTVMAESMKADHHYATRSPQVPVRKHRSQTATLPTVTQPTEMNPKSPQARRSHTTVLPAIPTVNAIQPMNPLTMSVASQLVMQSFNSLQAMNVALPKMSTENSEVMNGSEQQKVERTVTGYGKDAYEHYGVAQGSTMASATTDGTRHRGSSGSGSRSASN